MFLLGKDGGFDFQWPVLMSSSRGHCIVTGVGLMCIFTVIGREFTGRGSMFIFFPRTDILGLVYCLFPRDCLLTAKGFIGEGSMFCRLLPSLLPDHPVLGVVIFHILHSPHKVVKYIPILLLRQQIQRG